MRTSAWERFRLPLVAIPVGLAVAVAGIGLLQLIHLISNLSFRGEFSLHEMPPTFARFGWLAILVPAGGGLVIGLIARFVSPEIRGHGIPEAMQGVVMNRSRIPLKVAILKPLATALCIGTGGPFGAEGPIIATGGGIGSLAGQWIPHSHAERKVLLAAGAAAGMTAVFGTPFAGVLLAVELLLFEFRSRSLLPVAMAAGTAMAVRGLLDQPFPMLPLPAPEAPGPVIAAGSILVGTVCGALGAGMTVALHGIEHLYERLPLPRLWWPAIGGFLVGVIGWIDPRTLGAGYFNLRDLLDGNMVVSAILTLAILKFLSWSLYLGSGTAGGTLAPVMTVGGATAALLAHALANIPGFEHFPVSIAVLIGMAAVFAGMSRAFLASVAFAFEATHSTSTFGPLLLGCAFAVLVSRLLMKESIMTEKMARQGVRVPEDYEPDVLATTAVEAVMNRDPRTIPPDLPLVRLLDDIHQQVRLFPVVAEDRTLLGVVSRADLLEAVCAGEGASAGDLANLRPFTAHPDESLAAAADRMLIHGVGRLPVVLRGPQPTLVGLISRKEILSARRQRMAEELDSETPLHPA